MKIFCLFQQQELWVPSQVVKIVHTMGHQQFSQLPGGASLTGDASVTIGGHISRSLSQILKKKKKNPSTSITLEPLLLPKSVLVKALQMNRTDGSLQAVLRQSNNSYLSAESTRLDVFSLLQTPKEVGSKANIGMDLQARVRTSQTTRKRELPSSMSFAGPLHQGVAEIQDGFPHLKTSR